MINPGKNGSQNFIETGDGSLIIDTGANELLMLDPENWAITGEANGTYGYCKETDQIISAAADGSKPVLGACPYYSPQQLIEKGRKLAGDHQLTEDQKARYGLE